MLWSQILRQTISPSCQLFKLDSLTEVSRLSEYDFLSSLKLNTFDDDSVLKSRSYKMKHPVVKLVKGTPAAGKLTGKKVIQ